MLHKAHVASDCISSVAPSPALPPAVAPAAGGLGLVHVGVILLQVAAALGVGGEEVPGLRGTVSVSEVYFNTGLITQMDI